MPEPEVALLVSTFRRLGHLRWCLASIAAQQGVDGRFEVVVTDDGSDDGTEELVREHAATVPYRVDFTTHPHGGFQLTRCRNEGVRASTAPYIIFVDGDCVLPPDFVAKHLAHRDPGSAKAGNMYRLGPAFMQTITLEEITRGIAPDRLTAKERRRITSLRRRALFYQFFRHPSKPRLVGSCSAVWRDDYVLVNGYDENFKAWGCEDDDLTFRLRRAGIRVVTSLDFTVIHHLWHPPSESRPNQWNEGENLAYFRRPARLTRCRNGLTRRTAAELGMRLMGRPEDPVAAEPFLSRFVACPQATTRAEVELVVWPGTGRFSGVCDYRVLLCLAPGAPSGLRRRADLVVGDDHPKRPEAGFPLAAWDRALDAIV